MFTIPWEKIDRPFYIAGASNPNATTDLPLIEFRAPLNYVSIITGFYIRQVEGDPVHGFPSTCYGVNLTQAEIRIDNVSLFVMPSDVTAGFSLNQFDNYEKRNQFIPVRPNSLIQMGLYLPGTGFKYYSGYVAEIWGYFTRIPWNSYGGA